MDQSLQGGLRALLVEVVGVLHRLNDVQFKLPFALRLDQLQRRSVKWIQAIDSMPSGPPSASPETSKLECTISHLLLAPEGVLMGLTPRDVERCPLEVLIEFSELDRLRELIELVAPVREVTS